jgi:hypothetical protein
MDVNARLICKDDTYFIGEDNGHPCYTQTTLERNRPLAQPAEDGGVISSQSGLFFKAIAKAKSNQFNLPIFLAEGGKTVDMVVGTANRLVRCLRQLRRGSLPGFVDLLHSAARKAPSPREVDAFNRDFGRNARKAAGSMWLEHTYGWTPFMSDVKSAVDTVMDLSERPDRQSMTVKARTTAMRRIVNPSHILEVSPSILCERTRIIKEERRIKWRCSANPLDIPGRLGLTNPLEVAWELVPFSFVADWFLPIGNYLSSLDTSFRFVHQGGTVGLRRETSDSYYNPRSSNFKSVTGSGTARYVRVTRDPLSGPPMPSISQLSFEANLGASRITSAIALLDQALKGLRK